MGEFWHTAATEGPSEALDVVAPHYTEHVVAGAMFAPPAKAASGSLVITGGLRGGIRTSRQLARTGGTIATVAFYGGKQTAGKRIAASGRFIDAAGRVEILGYLQEGDLKRGAISAFGPVGSVFLYNRLTRDPSSVEILDPYSQIAVPTNVRQLMKFQKAGGRRSVATSGKAQANGRPRQPSQIPAKQKKRMWRMGLRWCRKHQRYDKCSLRAR